MKFLRILNIDDGEIVDHDTKYIADAVHEGELARSQLDSGDVLMTITGRVGSAAVVREEHLPANINQHIARLRVDTARCLPEFLSEWLNSPVGQELSNRFVSGGTRAALDYGAIRNIRIPLPDLLEQGKLVVAMDAARFERKAKLAEADALLAEVDDFVLDTLGLVPPQADSRRVFAVRPANLRGQVRLNSEYYHPERTAALHSLDKTEGDVNVVPLSQVVSFVREQLKTPTETYLGLAHVQRHTGELTDATDTASGNCFAYQSGDVLFSRLRPYLNKVHRAETDGSCSTEFHVLRIADTEGILPDYLAAILRSKVVLAQTVHMATGNTHPRLTNEDVANLMVPVPDPELQQVIADEISRRRQEARRLRAESEVGWQAAKQRFEGELLGGVAQ